MTVIGFDCPKCKIDNLVPEAITISPDGIDVKCGKCHVSFYTRFS